MSEQQRQNAISAKRLRRVEGLYERAQTFLGERLTDRMARMVTGATVQLDWKAGVLYDESQSFLGASYEGDSEARGWRRHMARFWKNGHVLSADYRELATWRRDLAAIYGQGAVRLALAYRTQDSEVHIGTFRDERKLRIATVEGKPRAQVFAREGPDPAELSWGVAVDEADRPRAFLSIATHAGGRLAAKQCLAEGKTVV